jgi:chromosome segregation protein
VRIDRLVLGRYGHLSDTALTFPADRGLHVVLGANEAGKSTALAAVGDALFGFTHRTDYAFLHDTKELRIALTLCARDGRAGTFVRLKRRKDDLLDAEDAPLPESALAAFLGGATRERFDRVFGLDAAELRQGGAAILEGKGEVGESILQAHTGMSGFRALVERLGKSAAQLYGDRRGQRELHVATDAFKAARQALDSRSVEPAAYKETREAQQRLTEARDANRREAEELQAERSRLERIHRTAPALRARARALAERAAMGEVPTLPADAEAQRQAATLARTGAAQDLDRERTRAEALARDLAALHVDAALLAEGEAIDALAAEQNRIAAARRDREKQRIVAGEHRRAVEDTGQRLGVAADAATLAAGVPNALTRGAAKRATDEDARLSTLRRSADELHEAAVRQRHEADAALADAPLAEPFAALRAAIDAAQAEGRIDDEVRQAGAAVEAAAAATTWALAALPLWSGSADALASAPVPLEGMVSRHAQTLQAAEAALRTQREQRAACERTLQEIAARLGGLAAAGDLPTGEAVAEARSRRDRTWRLIRRHRLEGGAAPTEAELAGLAPAAGLPDAFEDFLHTADALADRRAIDAERVATFEQLRARQAEQQALRDAAVAGEAAAQADDDTALAGWRELWKPAGVGAQDVATMRDWLRERAAVLALRAVEQEARRKLAALTQRRNAALSALAPLLPAEAARAADSLADLLRAATLICAERERADKARAQAQAQAEQARAAVEQAARALAKLAGERAAWRAAWAPVAASLGLAENASADDGKQALDLWNDIDLHRREWRAAEDRTAQMTLAIDGFEAAVMDLARRLAPDLAGADAHDAVRGLAARLAETRGAAAERDRALKAQKQVREALARAAAAHETAEKTLDGLRALAGVADDAGLQEAIARAADHTVLSRQIAERDEELSREDRSPAELEADAAGIDLDVLKARLAGIDERLRAIGEENTAYAGQLAELRTILQDMEAGHDAAGAAQDMQNALADAEDIAARYVRLRLAHSLLRAGIDRFRRQQQGPLLARAGALFARLTDGRYHRLSVEETETGQLFIVAVRPDRSECPAERLSEGTRDQLYLALRLAAIESYAARTEPLPFIADDLLVNFDDRRARAALRVLAEFGAVTQTILFTHHSHIADMAEPLLASLHQLPATP